MIRLVEKVRVKESFRDSATVTVVCSSVGADTLESILTAIQKLGNCGHSFPIVLDEGADAVNLGWDGDGSDYIASIKVEKES